MEKKMIREYVVKRWVYTGIDDFYLGFYIRDKFHFQHRALFFYEQGLEKISKGYLIGTEPSLQELFGKIIDKELKAEIEKVAKTKFNHGLEQMIKDLIEKGVLNQDVLTKEYSGCGFIGEDIVKILKSAYFETRYPLTPKPIHKENPFASEHLYPLGCSFPIDFAVDLGSEIRKKIEKEFNLTFAARDFQRSMEDDDWGRFCNVFSQKLQTFL